MDCSAIASKSLIAHRKDSICIDAQSTKEARHAASTKHTRTPGAKSLHDTSTVPLKAPSHAREAFVAELPLAHSLRSSNDLAQRAAMQSEVRTQADQRTEILDSLPANVALLDAAGAIVAVNESWRRFAMANGLRASAGGIGSNYLSVCDAVKDEQSLPASRAAAGIRAVLQGREPQFSMEYVLELPGGDVWFLMMVTPVGGARPTGATVMHLDITARKHDEGNLWRFAAAMDALADGVLLIDRASMAVTYVNDAACQLHDLSREQFLELRPWENPSMSPAEKERAYDRIVVQGGTAETEEVVWRRADGSQIWVEIRRHAHCLDGAVSIVVLMRDISARKAAESRIIYLSRVHAILSGINTLIVRVRNREELFREACRIPVEKGGFPACWIGTLDLNIDRLIPVASAGMSPRYIETLAEKLMHGPSSVLERSYPMRAVRDKQIRICNDSRNDKSVLGGDQHEAHGIRSFAMLPLIVADQVVGVLALYAGETDFFHDEEVRLLIELASDVSFAIDHIENQERLDYLAFYDALTGLPNRRLFLDRLAQCVRSAAGAGRQFAVCIADVERFRNFNDSLGRPSGDVLLKQVAQWLVTHVGDMLVGRLDSDHFALVFSDVEGEADAARRVETLINCFAAHSFDVDGLVYRMALRVGVAMFPDDGGEPGLLFKNAGAALTKAKAGHDSYLFYAQRMTETVAGRLGLENQLRQAVEREEFVVHYQPKFNLASGQLVGAEALLRWNDPVTGLMAPARFIPILEETGLILEVGRWVLRKVIADHAQWRRAGRPAVRIAVNVSPLQLRHSSLVFDIQQYVGKDQCVSAGLELEITESLIMEDVKTSIAALRVIRELGISIAIDDFGTGYSSLSYLAKLPVDTLKIDRSFISDMTAGPPGMSLVSSIINLAHSFKLKVVAEGVETIEQADLLRGLTCDEAQGYLYGKPLPMTAFQNEYLQLPAC